MSDLSGDLRGGPVEEAKIDNLHLHDLRHHFASWFVMRGGSLQALKKLLGHADLETTLRYAHLAPAFSNVVRMLRVRKTWPSRGSGSPARTS